MPFFVALFQYVLPPLAVHIPSYMVVVVDIMFIQCRNDHRRLLPLSMVLASTKYPGRALVKVPLLQTSVRGFSVSTACFLVSRVSMLVEDELCPSEALVESPVSNFEKFDLPDRQEVLRMSPSLYISVNSQTTETFLLSFFVREMKVLYIV